MVEHAVEMACSYMPETVADKCIDFVQEYGDEVIDLIIRAEANPELVCSLMTLCEVQKTWGKYKRSPLRLFRIKVKALYGIHYSI